MEASELELDYIHMLVKQDSDDLDYLHTYTYIQTHVTI